MKPMIQMAASIVAVMLASQALAVTNPNFAPEQTFSGSGDEFAGPDAWILRDLEDRRAVVSSVDFAETGSTIFWFETLTGGFGDNKLEQCVDLTDPDAFALTAVARTETPDSDLRVRLNVEFYASLADCDNRDDRLDDAEEDFRLEDDANTWTAFTLDAAPPTAASHARLSVRARDRSGSGNNPADEPKFIVFDRIEAPGTNVVNGDFGDTTIALATFGEDQGPFGWTLRSVIDQGQVVAESTALAGSAFQFTQLGEGFGDNTLEQCVPLNLEQFSLNVSVWPGRVDPDLRIRLNVDLYADLEDCLSRDNRLGRFDNDIATSELSIGAWNRLTSGSISRSADASYARIALRARDRSDAALSNPAVVLFDAVQLDAATIGVPVNHPIALWLMILALGGLALRFLNTAPKREENPS